MIDNEIVKALEYMIKNFDGKLIDFETIASALDLINRQRAEIEEWKKILESRHRVIDSLEDSIIGLPDQIRAETVKEFAERLKSFLSIDCRTVTEDNPNAGDIIFGYEIDDVDIFIDNLVKEMVGEG